MEAVVTHGIDDYELPEGVSPQTLAVRGGLARSGFFETSEAMYLTSGYVYDSAEAAERAFTGEDERFVYSRYGNPTVEMFQERLRLLDGAEACFATASGMAAVFVALGALLKAGDRLVAARSLFGSCFVVCNEILPRWGIETEFVDGEDLDQWERALATPADAVFFETPSNPMQVLVDVAKVSELAHAAGAKVVLDNVFATPLGQRGLDLGADVIVYSATKHIDGQGRVMGGAVLGTKEYIDGPVQTLMRHTGPRDEPVQRLDAGEGAGDHAASPGRLGRLCAAHRRVPGIRHSRPLGEIPVPAITSAVRPRDRPDVVGRHGGHLRAQRPRGRRRQEARLRGTQRTARHRHLQQSR